MEVSSDIADLRSGLLVTVAANDERDDKIGILREAADSLEVAIKRVSEQIAAMKNKIEEFKNGDMGDQGAQE